METEPNNPYAVFNYYIPEKQPEYEAFYIEHPELTHDEVVWMVNAGLSRPFYTEITVAEDSNPLLINTYIRLPENYKPAVLKRIYPNDQSLLATPETIDAFYRLREAAGEDGIRLTVCSAYRTIEYQRGLHDRAGKDGAVARPMHSEHNTGRALDLKDPVTGGLLDSKRATPSQDALWVAAHAHEYGFIVRYLAETVHITGYIPEPWHITYVGEQIASIMHEQGISSLEEFVIKYPHIKLP